MKISTKGRYGLRVMTDIAVNTEKGGLVSLKDIAEREHLSEKYLEQIVKPGKKITRITQLVPNLYILQTQKLIQ